MTTKTTEPLPLLDQAILTIEMLISCLMYKDNPKEIDHAKGVIEMLRLHGSSPESYLERMGVESAGDIAAKIAKWIDTCEEDEYYAIKYGRRMIEAFAKVKTKEEPCLNH